jgi:hypothetical protein
MKRFKDLDEASQFRAVNDYIYGWECTHDEVLEFDDVLDILNNNDDMYTDDGEFVDNE